MSPKNVRPPEIAGSPQDTYLFNEGRNSQTYRLLGAHAQTAGGVVFRVWAPNARSVSVIGSFNGWNGASDPLVSLGDSGIWAGYVGHAAVGDLYRFEIVAADGYRRVKSDPYARECELRPANASRVAAPDCYRWNDAAWLRRRAQTDWLHAPMSIYEVHAGSWMRHPDGRLYSWRELAARLIPYALEQGFTHLELLPVSEHPLDESWGYQTTAYFAPSARYGTPDDLKFFVDACHQAGLGVLLDWVPGHFPADEWALARFDGSALYEHEDPRLGLQLDWGTCIFNYGRHEVKSFLLSSAHCWLAEYHFDGLRVDAVASMLYLDYSRKPGEWLPNRFGGRENLDAIDFLRQLNTLVHGEFAGALTFAEESTAWPMVSRPVNLGGLGFSMKWSMGWMNDSLRYFHRDPLYRRWHHNELTFGQMYAYSENFVLPLSHDEVVHGKGSLIGKMPGDNWQRFANLRLLLAWQMTTPGKKLLFMGSEFGQWREWSEQRELDWALLGEARHVGVLRVLRDLNGVYRERPAMHELDFDAAGFAWIDCHDADHSVLSWLRRARDGRFVVVVCNFTPQVREHYRIGVPQPGDYAELINTDSAFYGGSNVGNGGRVSAVPGDWMHLPASLSLTLPPLACLVLALCD
ncbi:1,4-alpha-glucan branching protein GlgB [Rhodocyclus tenuis]|uniref:1,4-alpha-glucan branching protein GlgB n=1 Tax=Rhodocyclus gracilis TaxID=2929842 RepID=UPI001298DF0D|nr:1,4-alpha-glucan branching protein GlgB [Rhodocyclus gracilis]MRD72539.1 1,4-alpha-glucan branching protein GlgB [Rhodocyclus gracilis]